MARSYLVQAGQFLEAVEVASLPRYDLHAGHDLVNEPAVYLVRQVDVSLCGFLYSEEVDQISDSSALDEDCKDNDGEGGGLEHLRRANHLLIDHGDQREAHGSPE